MELQPFCWGPAAQTRPKRHSAQRAEDLGGREAFFGAFKDPGRDSGQAVQAQGGFGLWISKNGAQTRILLATFCGQLLDPLVVKDSFLRKPPIFSEKAAKRPPCLRRSMPHFRVFSCQVADYWAVGQLPGAATDGFTPCVPTACLCFWPFGGPLLV